jgi:hypothetical protein
VELGKKKSAPKLWKEASSPVRELMYAKRSNSLTPSREMQIHEPSQHNNGKYYTGAVKREAGNR